MKINTYVEFEWNKETQSYEEVKCESYEYEGEVALCGGGGGSSGSIEYPSEISTAFNLMMTGSISDTATVDFTTSGDVGGTAGIDMMKALAIATVGVSPYAGAYAFDPSGNFAVPEQSIADFYDFQNVDPDTQWNTFHANAKSKANLLFTGSEIENAVSEFAEKQIEDYSQAVNRFSSQMVEANALQSSSNILGLALIESRRTRDLDKFRTTMQIENQKMKTEYIKAAVHDMATILNMRLNSEAQISNMRLELARVHSIMLQEKTRDDIEHDVLDAQWDINIMKSGFSVISAPGGGVALPEKPSKMASAASGALSGAVAGAALGPGGAAAGAILGAASALF